MKKILGLLLCACIIILFAMPLALASEVKPGDTVTVTVIVSEDANDVKAAAFQLNYDKGVFESSYQKIVVMNLSGLKANDSNSVQLKVKENVQDGTYNITVTPENSEIKYRVSNNSVTVKGVSSPTPHTHTWGEWKITKTPNCTETGTRERVCNGCNEVEKESIPAKGHDWGEWVTTKEPAVGVAGEETRTCKNDSTHTDSRPIAALPETPCEHEHTSERVRVEGSCTEQKEVDIVCDDCGAIIGTEYGPKPAGHDWGDWEVTKPAAPGVEGEETRVCQNDPSHTETRPIPALPVVDPACPHTSITWKKVKTAGCTTEGLSENSCDECGKVFDSKIIPAAGHDDGEWVIVKKPTKTEDGLKQLKCTRCHEVLKEEIIPYITTEMRYNQTVCSLGIRFRDVNPNLTNKWFMFTPIDLSKDGTQTVDLIAANITYVGKATVKVSGDQVTVSYHLNWPVEIKDMQFALISNLDSVKDADIKTMKTYSFGQEISIANDLGGDTKVLLYVLGHINYDFKDASKELFIPNGAGYQKLVKQLQEIMD